MVPPLLIRDPKSGAYSRAFFDEIIERELERARRHKVILSVMSVVLTNWDSFVREEEAATVDGIVRTVANTLQANLRLTDFLFRWEDDEFLALLVEADLEACKLKVARLGETFQPWREGKGPVARPLKVRAGAATHGQPRLRRRSPARPRRGARRIRRGSRDQGLTAIRA